MSDVQTWLPSFSVLESAVATYLPELPSVVHTRAARYPLSICPLHLYSLPSLPAKMSSSGKGDQIQFHVEHYDEDQPSPVSRDDLVLDEVSPADAKRIMRKIDFRLVPLLGACYCISLLDRTNLSAAAIAGMTKQLHLNIGERYSIVALVFFVSYVVLQPPATVFMRFVGPRIFLSAIVFLWGVVMLSMGFAKEWTTLVGLRVVLGIFEAGMLTHLCNMVTVQY